MMSSYSGSKKSRINNKNGSKVEFKKNAAHALYIFIEI